MTTNPQVVKVILTDEEGHVEKPWAAHLGGNRYRLDNIPALARGVSWQDVIEADPGTDGFPEFIRVVEKSGNRTIRAWLEHPTKEDESWWQFVEGFVEMGCRYEALAPRAFVLSIPPALDVKQIYDRLDIAGYLWEQTDPLDENTDNELLL